MSDTTAASFQASAVAFVQSIQSLHERFGVEGVNWSERLAMLQEEVEEFKVEVVAGNYALTIEELADVAFVALGGLALVGWYGEDVLQIVAAKNNAKTHETHYWNEATGKITRRVPKT